MIQSSVDTAQFNKLRIVLCNGRNCCKSLIQSYKAAVSGSQDSAHIQRFS